MRARLCTPDGPSHWLIDPQVASCPQVLRQCPAHGFGAGWDGLALVGCESIEGCQQGIVHSHHNLVTDPGSRTASRFFASST